MPSGIGLGLTLWGDARNAFYGIIPVAGAEMSTLVTATNAANSKSANNVSAGAYGQWVFISITTPYSAGATFSLGNSSNTGLLVPAGTFDPTIALVGGNPWNYQFSVPVAWGALALPLLVTIGSPGAAGAASVLFSWSVPLT
jgi:hypothetical protein